MPISEQNTEWRPLTSDEFRDLIGRFATGVTVITAADIDGARLGTTASAVSSLSMDLPMLLICMNQTTSTGQAIARSRAFAVNILGERQGEIARRFASKGPDKFQAAQAVLGPAGQPLLGDALASLECRVVEEVVGGTHSVFIAEVDHAIARGGAPLAYFRGQFGRLELDDAGRAHAAQRARLLDGKLEAGAQLNLSELASALEIGPVALQLALGRLDPEGLVEHHADGFRVPPVRWEEVRDALRARCTVEVGVIDQTVSFVSVDELARLRRGTRILDNRDSGICRGPMGSPPRREHGLS